MAKTKLSPIGWSQELNKVDIPNLQNILSYCQAHSNKPELLPALAYLLMVHTELPSEAIYELLPCAETELIASGIEKGKQYLQLEF